MLTAMKNAATTKSRIFLGILSALLFVSGAGAEPSQEKPMDKRGGISGPMGQSIYSKPVWRRMGRGTYVGGYVDFEYRNRQDAKQKFELIRMVPFIYADIAEGIRFATEIEFEHGGATSSGGGDAKLEFAFLDYDLVGDALGVRGGILLIPLGKFNLIHDSPINDLNDRPLVSRFVIPSTFFEPGAGVFGSVYPFGPVKMDYQLYVTQGFNGGADGNGRIQSSDGLRNARSSVNGSGDNNENLSWSGRLGVSPLLGSEIGLSAHTGNWDTKGQNNLTIYALDWGFQWKFLEFLGEYANAQVERDPTTHASVPGRLDGYYGQINAHFLYDWIRKGSVMTGVVRWDSVDLDLLDQTSVQNANNSQRLTFGVNFRPLEQTVFKVDYQLNYENGSVERFQNNAWVLGFATYF